MGLDRDDSRPVSLDERERYRRVWTWYKANASRLAIRNFTDDYAKKSRDYIGQLAVPDSATADQMADAFRQVRTGLLEWAYHESDGEYKMAAYAGA